jgi:RNA polymerase sigma factor (sigma-70 family)
VWRIEAAQLIAALARITGDVGSAEELAQEALVAALERWPSTGVPPNPAGWLMTTAKNRAIDAHRRRERLRGKAEQLGRQAEAQQRDAQAAVDDAIDDALGDDLLRLIFTACHPVLSLESRVALTLRCLGGLTTDEIARAFLVPAPTAAQRIVRAKKTLADRAVRLELPTPEELAERLAPVLEVIFLIFNEGYAATTGPDWVRPDLCHEALRLGRILAVRVPAEPEVHGLLALMELQASRLPARTDRDGAMVLLAEQDRRRWDRLLIRRGLAGLQRAEELPGPIGPYTLQAGIAACHARAATVEQTDWTRIAALYQVLHGLWPSPVVELNRAVAVGMSTGPAAGLVVVDRLVAADLMTGYPHLHAVRADLLARLDRPAEAAEAFQAAAGLTGNQQERALFTERARQQRLLAQKTWP